MCIPRGRFFRALSINAGGIQTYIGRYRYTLPQAVQPGRCTADFALCYQICAVVIVTYTFENNVQSFFLFLFVFDIVLISAACPSRSEYIQRAREIEGARYREKETDR